VQPRVWTLDALTVGTKARFEREVTEADVDVFAQLSGDHNPLHANRAYAQKAGYRDRVVHGALLSALVSRFVGMELPGRRSLLLSMKLDYVAPSFPGDTLEVSGTVQSLHAEERVVVLRIYIRCGDEVRARGSVVVKIQP
jgi:3-hydroxybutyryl-CoA dehydratase